MSNPIDELHSVFSEGLRKAMNVPTEWKYVASTFEGEALEIIDGIPEDQIAVVSTTFISQTSKAVRMTFFLSPAGIDHIISKTRPATRT